VQQFSTKCAAVNGFVQLQNYVLILCQQKHDFQPQYAEVIVRRKGNLEARCAVLKLLFKNTLSKDSNRTSWAARGEGSGRRSPYSGRIIEEKLRAPDRIGAWRC